MKLQMGLFKAAEVDHGGTKNFASARELRGCGEQFAFVRERFCTFAGTEWEGQVMSQGTNFGVANNDKSRPALLT